MGLRTHNGMVIASLSTHRGLAVAKLATIDGMGLLIVAPPPPGLPAAYVITVAGSVLTRQTVTYIGFEEGYGIRVDLWESADHCVALSVSSPVGNPTFIYNWQVGFDPLATDHWHMYYNAYGFFTYPNPPTDPGAWTVGEEALPPPPIITAVP